MALLQDIHKALLDEKSDVGSILRKLRYLASRLDADVLEEWIQHETEGYPDNTRIPSYRIAQVTYTGTFSDGLWTINNVSIPEYSIAKNAGKQWITTEIRDGLPTIDRLLKKSVSENWHFSIKADSLRLFLHNKIYKGMNIVEIQNRIDTGVFIRIQETVRDKVLDFTLKLERQVPLAAEIFVGQAVEKISRTERQGVERLTQQTIHGDIINIHADAGAAVTLSVVKGDTTSLVKALETVGFSAAAAEELACIAAQEAPQDENQPLGGKARKWLGDKLKEGGAEALKIGKDVLHKFIIEAFRQYYGL